MKRVCINRRINICLIAVVMAITACVFFIRCYVHVPSGDELLYEYVWEEDDPTDLWEPGHRYERKVSNLSDIFQTQYLHYMKVNGRTLVHAVEQAFTGHFMSFCIINTMVFLLFIWLIVAYSTERYRYNFPLWISVIVSLLWLMPYQQSLWTSVNYGLNYLWPATMAVGMLFLWRLVIEDRIRWRYMGAAMLLGLLFGWTHEAFVIPIAGAMFLYYCFNFKLYKGKVVALTIPFWATSAIMAFAPGNISRFFVTNGRQTSSVIERIIYGTEYCLHLVFIWALLAALVCALIFSKRDSLKKFFIQNAKLFYVFVIAFCFSLVATTAPYAHTFVELTALLLTLRLICATDVLNSRLSLTVALALTAIFIPQQIVLAKDTVTNYRLQRKLLAEYFASPDGFVKLEYPDISWTSEKFMRIYTISQDVMQQYLKNYSAVYTKGKKEFLLYDEYDAAAFETPDKFFIRSNRFPGNAPVYKSPLGSFMWVNPDSIAPGTQFVAHLYPVDWYHDAPILLRIKFALMPDGYPETATIGLDTVRMRLDTLYRIKLPSYRKIESIDTVLDYR